MVLPRICNAAFLLMYRFLKGEAICFCVEFNFHLDLGL